MRILIFTFGFLAFVTWLGCGPGEGRVRIYPVHGKVLVKGQPAQGARVVFYPTAADAAEQKIPTPAGITDANGEFELDSYKSGDGAPAGEYKVTVVWPEPPPPNPPDIYDLKDRLNGRYADPQKSKLTAKVEKGGGELQPFELQ